MGVPPQSGGMVFFWKKKEKLGMRYLEWGMSNEQWGMGNEEFISHFTFHITHFTLSNSRQLGYNGRPVFLVGHAKPLGVAVQHLHFSTAALHQI